jgi:hypothetical protein
MKYLIRSIKYFFYFAILTSLILFILVYLDMAEADIEKNFEGGYDAFWKMGLFFAAVAAIYPKFAFINRRLYIDPAKDITPVLIGFMRERRYEVESQSEDKITFRLKGFGSRLIKMCEDRITVTRTAEGYHMEGLRKDVLRFASALEYKFQDKEED